MIIEIYGLPGAGKSYLLQRLNGGKSTGIVSENWIKRVLIRFVKKIVIFTPSSCLLRKKIKSVIKNIPEIPVYYNRRKSCYINNLVMVAFGYHWAGHRSIYMDEGIIHRLVSLAVNYALPIEQLMELMDIFQDYLNFAEVIYLNASIEECMDSIRKRNRHKVEMDELSDNDLRHLLSDYQKCFDAINKKYEYITVTRNDYEHLERLLK